MENAILINKMVSEYRQELAHYQKMKRYYTNKHDIFNPNTFTIRKDTDDKPISINWIEKFISEEVAYGLNKPVTYTSKSGKANIEKDIAAALEHFNLTHDQKIMRELEIYGKCYIIYYFDKCGRLSERIITPENGIEYRDDDDDIVRFIYFYKKKYMDDDFYNVYYADGTIEIYKNNVLIDTQMHPLKCMPVSVCEIDESETIYAKIKELNDSYDELISNQQCLISEFRNAYVGVCSEGVDPNSLTDLVKTMKNKESGVLFYPNKNAKPDWIIKNINDVAIKNQIEEIKENMYAQTGHIDFQEKLSSNLSGVALQSRLTGLDQRVNMVLNSVLNVLYERVRFICMYLKLCKNAIYDYTDIRITANVDIPLDILSRVNEVVQLGDIISHQTKLERLHFIENPQLEIERCNREKQNDQTINLDKVDEAYFGNGEKGGMLSE